MILINGTTTVKSLAVYTCSEDYWLVGEAKQKCTKEGKWSHDTPSCECKLIGNPQAAPNGKIAAIKAIADMSYMCSSFKSSTHGALHPIPQPSENPPMHAAEFIPNNDDMG